MLKVKVTNSRTNHGWQKVVAFSAEVEPVTRVLRVCASDRAAWRKLSCWKFVTQFQRTDLSSHTQTSRSTGRTS